MPIGAARAVITRKKTAAILGDPNLAHAIHANLVWFVGSHPTGAAQLGTERLSGNAFTLTGSCDLAGTHPTNSWKSLRTTASTGQRSRANRPAAVETIGNICTFWAHFNLSAQVAAWATLFASQWAGNNADAWWVTAVGRNGTTSQCFLQYSDPTYRQINSDNDAWPTSSGTYTLAVVRNGTSVDFYLNGSKIGVTKAAPNSNAPAWANAGATDDTEILANAYTNENNWGFTGEIYRAMLFTRALTATNISDLHSNPLLGVHT